MEEDQKLKMLATFVDSILNDPDAEANMYFVMPGGVLTGTPINENEYYSDPAYKNLDVEPIEERRFFYLKDAQFSAGDSHPKFSVTIFDGSQVSAWGFYTDRDNAGYWTRSP